jgi:hypothetical protein
MCGCWVGVRWRARKSAIEDKIDGERNQPNHDPSDIIGERHAEMDSGVHIVVDLAEEPPIPA